jgi:hypothetical protein
MKLKLTILAAFACLINVASAVLCGTCYRVSDYFGEPVDRLQQTLTFDLEKIAAINDPSTYKVMFLI